VNTRHEVLDWFGSSREVIALRSILMYYVIEIDFSLVLSGSFWVSTGCPSECLEDHLDVDLSSLFIIGESPHRV
jgi:hypothetical protein